MYKTYLEKITIDLEQTKQEITKIKNIKSTEIKNINNNTVNNNTINFVKFGSENHLKLTDDEINTILFSNNAALTSSIAFTNFNKRLLEQQNIKITNLRSKR